MEAYRRSKKLATVFGTMGMDENSATAAQRSPSRDAAVQEAIGTFSTSELAFGWRLAGTCLLPNGKRLPKTPMRSHL